MPVDNGISSMKGGTAFINSLSTNFLRQQEDRKKMLEDGARNAALQKMADEKYERETFDPQTAAYFMGVPAESLPASMKRYDPKTIATFMEMKAKQKRPIGRIGEIADPSWKPHLAPATAALPVEDEATLRHFAGPYGGANAPAAGGINRKDRLPVNEVESLSNRQEGISGLHNLLQKINDNKDVMGPIQGRMLGLRAAVGSTDPQVVRFQGAQGVYNDVRQAVGKAKEGGVLRKEDEIKYEKILGGPNLTFEGASEILTGLEQRYREDLERRTGNLTDAGWAVPDKFRRVMPFTLRSKGKVSGAAPAAAPAGGLTPQQEARRQELLSKKNQR